MLYIFSLRWGIYTGIAFLTFLGTLYPVTRIFTTIVIIGYFAYMILDTLKIYTEYDREYRNHERSLKYAVITNGIDFVFLFLALLVGVMI